MGAEACASSTGHCSCCSWRLRRLPYAVRSSIGIAVLVLLGGLVVSGMYMAEHYENRDGTEGLSFDDLRGAYHGVNKPAPMLSILENGHIDPAADSGLTSEERQTLLDWLRSDRISDDFDNFDLGDSAPAEIVSRRCLSCHSPQASAGGDIGQRVPLLYWSDVEKVAYSRDIPPTDPAIMVMSMHAHSISLGVLLIVTIVLVHATSWPRAFVNVIVLASAIGLLLDLGSWFPASVDERFVYLIVIGGWMFAGATGLGLLSVVVDAWIPGRIGVWKENS